MPLSNALARTRRESLRLARRRPVRRLLLTLALLGAAALAPAVGQAQTSQQPAPTLPKVPVPQATPQPAPQAQPTPQPQPAPQPAPAGQAANPGDAAGGDTIHGDWVERCTASPPPDASPPLPGRQEVCFLIQHVTRKPDNQLLMKITIGFFGAKRQLAAVVAMPLGVPLSHGIQVGVDGKGVGGAPFDICRQESCLAFLPLSDELLTAFKAGSQGVMQVRGLSGDPVNLPFSLKGFTAGYGSIQ